MQCRPRSGFFTSIIGEVHLYGRLALGQLLGRSGAVPIDPEVVVRESRRAVLHVQAPAAKPSALRHNDTVHRFVAGLDLGNDFKRRVLDVDEIVLEQAIHALVEGQALTPEHQVRPSRQLGVEQFLPPVVEGQHLVLDRLADEDLLELREDIGMLLCEVGGHAEVFLDVVQLPCVLGKPVLDLSPWLEVHGAGEPAVEVDTTVAEHLEVLDLVPIGRLGVVPGVDHAGTFDGALRRAVDDTRLRQSSGLEDGRHDVDHVMPLAAHFTLPFDPLWPVDDHGVSGAAVVGGHLLGPGERRIEADRPTGRHVRIGGRVAPRVVVLEHEVDVRTLRLSVEIGHLVVQPGHPAFGTRPVVTGNVKDQGVVEFAHVLDSLNDPPGFVIGHLEEAGKDLGLAGEKLLFIGREILPVLDVGRLLGQLGVGFGITPSFSCCSKIRLRITSQPSSNLPFHLSM